MKVFLDTNVLIDYLLKREPFYGDAPAEYCRGTLLKLRSVLNVVGEDDTTVFAAARNTGFPDFEDSMQHESALSAGTDYIITRNPKDFKDSRIPVCSPAEFLVQIEKK
ncbi:MAG: PIN domain-containing protein [Treponema sp.]|nr:PIN domain-containing protein [Treponema sp.]